MSGALDFLRGRLPDLFARGVAFHRERAASGDAAAQARLDDILGARSAIRLVVDGGSELFIGVDGGQLTVTETRPAELPIRLVVAADGPAMDAAFGRVSHMADDVQAARRVAEMASKQVESILEGKRLEFHVVVEDVPDLGRAVVRVGLGTDEPPDAPTFTATVTYADLQDARERGKGGPELLMGGRVRFTGDYVPALQLGMELAAAQSQSRRPGTR